MKGSHIVGQVEGVREALSVMADVLVSISELGSSALDRKERLEDIISQLKRMNKHLQSMTDEEFLEGEK